jgi:uncharacterized membrane protein
MYLAITLLRIGISIPMIAFGIHQLVKPEGWTDYLPEWLKKLSPISSEADIRIHSLGNFLLGIMLLINAFPKFTGWATLIWWITILPFALKFKWSIGLRDLSIILATGAYISLLYA